VERRRALADAQREPGEVASLDGAAEDDAAPVDVQGVLRDDALRLLQPAQRPAGPLDGRPAVGDVVAAASARPSASAA
jgi:hypothetical protein